MASAICTLSQRSRVRICGVKSAGRNERMKKDVIFELIDSYLESRNGSVEEAASSDVEAIDVRLSDAW